MEKSMNLKRVRWTDADHERIRAFVRDGVSIFRAAAVLNRSTKSVRSQAHKIGSPFPTTSQVRKRFAQMVAEIGHSRPVQ
jgi:hypothetical protein